MDFNGVKYAKGQEEAWDRFVLDEAVNGTFLQTRNFLNYHPKDRFLDDSVLIHDHRGNLAAVCPACCTCDEGMKTFDSHKGSTFGGILINRKHYKAEHVLGIMNTVEEYARKNGYRKILLKQTSDIFCREQGDLMEYCFYYQRYSVYKELNLYIDFDRYKGNILSNFSQGKRTNVHNCQKAGLYLKKLETGEEIGVFYQILCKTLEKYGLTPVHTVDELKELKNTRLKGQCEFYGLFQGDRMIAGSMVFLFHDVGAAHTQYLCALPEYDRLSPMSYMYFCMIEKMRERGFKKLSWGIASEHRGYELNIGLTRSKENFGSAYSVNRSYYKLLD